MDLGYSGLNNWNRVWGLYVREQLEQSCQELALSYSGFWIIDYGCGGTKKLTK